MAEYEQTRSGLLVPAGSLPEPKPVAVDLFAGAGGFSCGFHQAGFHVAAAVEFDFHAATTYLLNLGGPDTIVHYGPGVKLGRGKVTTEWRHERAGDVLEHVGTGWIANQDDQLPCEHFWLCDIHDVTGEEILDWLGIERGEVTAVIGGPPCQGFSKANGKRHPGDPRNTLVFQFIRVVLEIWPKTFVMENVPGILDMVTPEGVPVLDALARVLADGGWSTYDAIRQSLASMHDAGAAFRKESKHDKRSEPADVEDDQLALFEAVDA